MSFLEAPAAFAMTVEVASSFVLVSWARYVRLLFLTTLSAHPFSQIPLTVTELCLCGHPFLSHLRATITDLLFRNSTFQRGGLVRLHCGGFFSVRFYFLSDIFLALTQGSIAAGFYLESSFTVHLHCWVASSCQPTSTVSQILLLSSLREFTFLQNASSTASSLTSNSSYSDSCPRCISESHNSLYLHPSQQRHRSKPETF